jgi:GntR family transcriptional repressor for pyruvate dehydrogenase complex
MFEPALARMAASRISDEEVDTLRASVDEMLRNPDRPNVFIEANRVFHSTITAVARNGSAADLHGYPEEHRRWQLRWNPRHP